MKIYKNIPIASFDMPNIAFTEEAIESALLSLKDTPITYEDKVIGMVKKANYIEYGSNQIFGDVEMWIEPKASIQINKFQDKDGITVVNDFSFMSVTIIEV